MKTRILHWQFMWAVLATAALGGALVAQQQGPQHPPPAAAPQAQPARTDGDAPATKPRAGKIVLPAGTRLPLVLHNAITTRNAKPGDGVYLETLFPITQENRVIVPAGSYVQGEILEAKRPGRVKGRGEIRVRLNTMILPNGYTVSFNAVPTNAGTGGKEQVEEGGKTKGGRAKDSEVWTGVKNTPPRA